MQLYRFQTGGNLQNTDPGVTWKNKFLPLKMLGSNSVTKLTLAVKLALHSLTCLAPKNPNAGGQNSNTEPAKYVIQNGKWTCSYIAHFYST